MWVNISLFSRTNAKADIYYKYYRRAMKIPSLCFSTILEIFWIFQQFGSILNAFNEFCRISVVNVLGFKLRFCNYLPTIIIPIIQTLRFIWHLSENHCSYYQWLFFRTFYYIVYLLVIVQMENMTKSSICKPFIRFSQWI